MAADLKIEVFSIDLFRRVWYELNMTNFVIPRLRNYGNVSIPITCMNAVFNVVKCRRVLCTRMLWTDIYFDFKHYSTSTLDFYLYLQDHMPGFLPYSGMIIFDKVLMACAVVLEMASTCMNKSNNMFKYSAPICFAMYFDIEYRDEFYKKGGWEGLEIHANSYKALCSRYIEKFPFSARHAFNESINVDYAYDLAVQIFKEKTQNCKVSCAQCLPLLEVVCMLSGTSNEFINERQLTECYLQLILPMLSKEELQKREKDILRDSGIEAFSEVLNFPYPHIHKYQSKKIPYDKVMEYLNHYRIQNTHDYMSRLFTSKGNPIYECMFCSRTLKSSEVSEKDYVKRINSAIKDTLIPGRVNTDANKNPEKNDNANAALQLFCALGMYPLTTLVIQNLSKKGRKPPKISSAETSAQNAEEIVGKEKKKKRNKSKKKSKNPIKLM